MANAHLPLRKSYKFVRHGENRGRDRDGEQRQRLRGSTLPASSRSPSKPDGEPAYMAK
jgi:hypothetical protein